MAKDGGADEPMVIDQGRAGLEQSLHYPNVGRSATNVTVPAKGALEEVVQIVYRYAAIEAQKATEATANTATITTRNRDTEAITRDKLNRSIKAAFRRFMPKTPQAVPGTTGPRSWANVAAAGGSVTTNTPKVFVPVRIQREVIIQNSGSILEMTKRTAVEAVQAMNMAIGAQEAVAARRLPSGDVVVTFLNTINKYKEGTAAWIRVAFGATTEQSCREFMVIAKGLLYRILREAHTKSEELLEEIQQHAPKIGKMHPIFPRNPEH
ncbi:Uu.00g118460.m01.CDS01 [Anthostomella pinea]|uniref:Uu.00g118460.m01.CDS01 n=1 Tax=Anthostomella pinea TaxID=933095 RepID=A0AAI8VGG6_9PEZI|nr:Uu.00g118460.m01.CDS01 [Anthostomella pinea]